MSIKNIPRSCAIQSPKFSIICTFVTINNSVLTCFTCLPCPTLLTSPTFAIIRNKIKKPAGICPAGLSF